MPDFIKLPSERVEQLRLLSAALNKPIVDLLGDFIRAEIAKGHLADAVPGFAIGREEAAVAVQVGEGAPARLSLESARDFAASIEHAVAGSKAGMIDLDADWSVSRAGSGIRIGIPTGESKIVARDVARDISRLLVQAAA